jgi:Zn-dependent peptidase ImmA (M78 family)/DNA-binding XRE family transcriptional regulator
MTIGEQLKSARQRANMNLRKLGEQAGVSAQAISKYERGMDVPSSGVLMRLAKVFNVKVDYFLRPPTVTLSEPCYRKRKKLSAKDSDKIHAQTLEWLERYITAESLFDDPVVFRYPDIVRRIAAIGDAERVAQQTREAWNLGMDPISNLVEVMEGRGIKVGVVDGADEFDALILWANETIPVMVVRSNVDGDRQRLSLAHELGHLILDIPEEWSDKDAEKAAYRFGAAFLAPAASARQELGEHRSWLDIYELHLLKHKYGMSMQAWIFRAQDLGILPDADAVRMYRWFNSRGWREKEPGDPYPPEKTLRLEQLVTHALAEDIISQTRAAELLGRPLQEFWLAASKHHDGLPLPVHP